MNTRVFRTGELANKAGVNKETIRFYEKQGLLSDPNRTDSGYRKMERKRSRGVRQWHAKKK